MLRSRMMRPIITLGTLAKQGNPYFYQTRGLAWNTESLINNLKTEVNNVVEKTPDYSQESINRLVENGAAQTVNAMKIMESKINEMDTEGMEVSATFNAGLLQITFTKSMSKTKAGFESDD